MKILNLYAGIGGNRKLWGDEHEITAVESMDYIADVYAQLFPQDTLVRGDAHQYLLDHYGEFDFIWSSPPCPTHSVLQYPQSALGNTRYPDMALYQEIIFLKHFYRGKWLVENVVPYYAVLVQPTSAFNRHLYWSNFPIPFLGGEHGQMARNNNITNITAKLGIELPADTKNARKLLRNAVHPEIGAHILKAAMYKVEQTTMLTQPV